jgi:cell shape-determining protein MreC
MPEAQTTNLPTFDSVWADIQESRKELREFRESLKETKRVLKEDSRRLKKMRKYADLHSDKRTFLGAVAGIVVTDEIRKYALNKGLYFIEYAGETFYITPPKDKPKEW